MRKRVAIAAASALAVLALTGPAQALAAPELEISSSHLLSSVHAGTYARYELAVSNAASASEATTSNVTVDFSVPAGMEVISAGGEKPLGFEVWSCSTPTSQSAQCVGPEITEFAFPVPINPGEEACAVELIEPCHIRVIVRTDENATPGPASPTIEASGGGDASPATTSDPIEITPPPAFEVASFDGETAEEGGAVATQAGSHPFLASTVFTLSSQLVPLGLDSQEAIEVPADDLKDTVVKLPPGVLANPQGIPTCKEAQIFGSECPVESQVGVATPLFDGTFSTPGQLHPEPLSLYNMEAGPGHPALLAFETLGVVIQIYADVRTGEDYGATVTAKNAPQSIPIGGFDFKAWGAPADHSHDAERICADNSLGCPSAEAADPHPFFVLPTSCTGPGPNNSLQTDITVTGWQGGEASSSFLSHDNTLPTPNPIGVTGCNAVDFSPTLEARPTTNLADSPSGLDVDLHVPQHEACDAGPPVTCENAEAHLKDTTVTLPEGLVVNPSGANGLSACTEAQLGFTAKEGDAIHTTPEAATCPEAAKLGTVEVDSPLLDHPLKGNAYIAQPYQNPFGSLLALYITINDPQTGVVVKLAGEVHADPTTGRLTTTVLHNPQLPFEDFKLHFFSGAGGSLRTPATCGTYSTTSSLTPWSAPDSGPPATPSDPWAISQAPGGGACPTSQGARPNAPDLDAGSISPIAASYSPAVVTLRRNDGSQEFSAVNLTLPPGMTGKLAGISQCSDSALATAAQKSGNAEKSSPSCPANSQIGTVDVAAGAGPAPYHAQGTAYLTGPYKGAPISMAIITPATAGPFDLGTVVVRVALHLNPASGQITATSDQLPHILQGIPLDIRSAQVKLDRPSFTRNGTSCDPSAFSGQLTSTLSQVASLSERFQLGECTGLPFKPKLGIRLIGGTKRGAHPALKATLTMPEGGANIAKAAVALPRSEFLDQAHIGTVCTRVQFQADECPAASIYGHATATSPLVDYPLTGPAYLRSSSNKLPDLVIALKGPASQPVKIEAAARIDSIKGGIRSTFEGIPDLPVSSFVLEMEGGRKGLLQNSTNICKGLHKATAEFDGQNGKVADLSPVLRNSKCGKAKRGKGRHKKARRTGLRGGGR
jgi:hypothetical protein